MSRLLSSRRPARGLAAAAAALLMVLVAASCQQGAVMWGGCSPAADGNEFGTDGSYVLWCRDSTWRPLMTVDEYVRAADGERLTPAPVPTGPSPTTTSTTTSTTVAAPTIDVDHAPASPSGQSYTAGRCDTDAEAAPGQFRYHPAQSFVAGRSGTLTRVDVVLTRYGEAPPLIVTVRPMVDGVPGATVLGTGTYVGAGSSDTGTLISIELSSPAPVTAATAYAVVLTTAECSTTSWWRVWAVGPGGIDGGSAFLWRPSSGWGADGAIDVYLRTWVR